MGGGRQADGIRGSGRYEQRLLHFVYGHSLMVNACCSAAPLCALRSLTIRLVRSCLTEKRHELYAAYVAVSTGVLPSSPYLNDMYELSLKDKTWERVTVSGARPTPRALSSLARVQRDTLLFGGFSGYAGGLDDKLHNDLYSYES